MLLTKTVIMKWRRDNKEWYDDKGYIFSKYGDEFEIKTEDLTKGSSVKVKVQCDECGEILKNVKWADYFKSQNKHKDNKYYCKKCALKLFQKEKELKTRLKNGLNSFGYWLVKNLPIKQAIEIIVRWNDELNGCDIRDITFCSQGFNGKGYYFKCYKGLHPNELHNIASFTHGKNGSLNCVACNSFAQWGIDNLSDDFLEKYWDYKKNIDKNGNPIDPWKIAKNSNKKVFIFCQIHKYHGSYDIRCDHFTKGIRCSYCAGRNVHYFDSLGYLYPQVIPIWSDKNEKSPFEYSPFSEQSVYWKCLDEKHKDYYRRIQKSQTCEFRCPECVQEMNESIIQNKTRLYLESLNYEVLHENNCTIVPINPKTKYQLPFDNEIILINGIRLICEVNGVQHYQITNYHNLSAKKFNTTPEYELHYQKLKDRYKKFVAYKSGYEYLEIPYWVFDKEDTYKKLINNKINQILESEVN